MPVEQMNYLTGRDIPYAIGLAERMKDPGDKALHEPAKYQKGIELIFKTLEESPEPVTIITNGSVRDLVVAFNRKPELFKKKVSRIYSLIGNAVGKHLGYNVLLDPNAFRALMASDLPVYWVPAVEKHMWGMGQNASCWRPDQRELLEGVTGSVLNFYIYALLHKSEDDPVGFLYSNDAAKEEHKIISTPRPLWCAALFAYIAERKYICRDGVYLAVPADKVKSTDQVIEIFTFKPISVRIDADGRQHYEDGPGAHVVERFHINEMEKYSEMMTSVTRELLKELEANKVVKK